MNNKLDSLFFTPLFVPERSERSVNHYETESQSKKEEKDSACFSYDYAH